MVVFQLVHLVASLAGIASAAGLFRPGDRAWQLSAVMWVSLVGAAGSGLVLSLSSVGTGSGLPGGLLLAKVGLTAGLFWVMYTTLADVDSDDPPTDILRLGAILALWVLLLGLGGMLAR